jgi:hypothetical protein
MKEFGNSVAQAVGAALLVTAGSAFAYTPASNTDADVVAYWAGATASTLSAQELAVASVCDTDPTLLYVKNTAVGNDSPGNDWALACKTAASGTTISGLPNNLRVLLIKRDRGGSGVGVGPVQVNSAISFLTVNSTNCNIAVTPGVNNAPAIVNPDGGFVPLVGCVNTAYTTNAYVDIGTSDVEPNKFFGINTPVVDGVGVPYVNGAPFEVQNSLAALAFNTPVTLTLYRALQGAQYPGASNVCNPANIQGAIGTPTATPGFYNSLITVAGNPRTDITNGESEACMPSLTREEINSLLTGKLVTWNQLLNSAGGAALPAQLVQICRRVEGSGTQATINGLISGFPCDANAADQSIDIVQPRNVASAQVVLNSGSGDVDNCLHNFDGTSNPYAIGVLSVEGRTVGKDRNWRYIKVDGAAPTLRNIHAGDYWLWSQQSIQRRYNALTQNTAVGADDTFANRSLIYTSLATGPKGLNSLPTLLKLNSPANLANCIAGTPLTECGSLYTWGQSGWLATPTSTLVYDVVLDASTRPVNAWTREVTTGKVNLCQVPVKATAGSNAAKGVIVTPNPTWTP